MPITEGSFETKVPTIWTDQKHFQEEAEPRRNSDVEKVRREKIRDGESQKREEGARKGREVAKHCVFPMMCGSEGSKSRLAKAAGAETSGPMRHEKLHAVVGEAHVEVKLYKTPKFRTAFGSCDVQKVHAVAARSAFGSQKCQNTSGSADFWKWRRRKSACRCGAKHIWK